MSRQLKKIPHVEKLIDTYTEFRTIKHTLEELDISYTPYQLRSVANYLFSDNIKESLDGLSTLSIRYSFANWLWGVTNKKDELLTTAALFVFEKPCYHLPGRQPSLIRNMRIFLTYAIKADPEFKYNFSTDTEYEVISAYNLYLSKHQCPSILKQFAASIVDQTPKEERIRQIKNSMDYSDEWLSTIDWAGCKFLENSLATPTIRSINHKLLTQNTVDILKTAKQNVLNDPSTRLLMRNVRIIY